MYRICLDVRDQKIKVTEIVEFVSNTVGEYVANFSFSEDWDGYIKTAVFKTSDGHVYERLVNANEDFPVPDAVLRCSGFMRIGVYGENGNGQIKPTVYTSAIGIEVGADTSGETAQDTVASNLGVLVSEITRQAISNVQDYIDTAVNDAIFTFGLQSPKVVYNTKSYWDKQSSLISQANTIYVYTDYQYAANGKYCAGLKVGDGLSYLIDMPFLDEIYLDHVNNSDIHITSQERSFWNSKVRCFVNVEQPEELIFTTD